MSLCAVSTLKHWCGTPEHAKTESELQLYEISSRLIIFNLNHA